MIILSSLYISLCLVQHNLYDYVILCVCFLITLATLKTLKSWHYIFLLLIFIMLNRENLVYSTSPWIGAILYIYALSLLYPLAVKKHKLKERK